VWRLKKSIYGLKQLARLWHIKVKKHLKTIGFDKNYGDKCVFICRLADKTSLIYLHVDDMIITGDDIQSVKMEIKAKWAMEDLGIAKHIVGIEINNSEDGSYQIHQESIQHVRLQARKHPLRAQYPSHQINRSGIRRVHGIQWALPKRDRICHVPVDVHLPRYCLRSGRAVATRFQAQPETLGRLYPPTLLSEGDQEPMHHIPN
jgi:hypothetical protein